MNSLEGTKRYLFNLYLPKDDGGTTEIDVVFLHDSGMYVFESKNYSGWIFGTETQKNWTQTLPMGPGKSRITSYNVCYTKLLRAFPHEQFHDVYDYVEEGAGSTIFYNKTTYTGETSEPANKGEYFEVTAEFSTPPETFKQGEIVLV